MGDNLPKRTPWFNVLKQPPLRVGWYEMDLGYGFPSMHYFDGIDWVHPVTKAPVYLYHADRWRGLTKPVE